MTRVPRSTALGAVLCCVAGFGVAWALPQDDRPDGPGVAYQAPTPEQMAAGMQKWQATMASREQHKRLAWFLGEWDTTMKMWMGGAGSGAPMTSTATTTYRWLVPDKWLLEESKGSMMGMPLTAYTIIGYDNYQKQYVTAHVDSMTTTMLTSTGNWGKDGTVLQAFGAMDEPMDDTRKTVRYVTRVLGADKFAFEIHDTAIGETGTKVVEFVHTRKKQ